MKSEIEEVYEKFYTSTKNYGEFHKCIFHLHTPASHDYYLYEKYKKNEENKKTYDDLTDENLYEIAYKEKLIPKGYKIENNSEIFDSDKELISYLLIVEKIIKEDIKTIVISDHNTIKGYYKLVEAIKIYNEAMNKYFPEVILGIEISCADLNHVVSMVDIKSIKKLEDFIKENIMNEMDGTYLTSRDVIKKINEIGGYSYIAHINSSRIFDHNFLSGAYKKELFSLNELNLIGISDISHKLNIEAKLKKFNKNKKFNFILDNDSHCIENITNKVMWLKGTKGDFRIIKDLIRDYDITVSLDEPSISKNYIEGLIIENNSNNFIISQNETDKYAIINLSSSLNCIIGGRGTGKSTILNIIQYMLGIQVYTEEQLEMICKHSIIWIIYKYCNEEYIIQLTPPQKSNDEDIMKYFKETPAGYYEKKIKFDKESIKRTTLRKYLEIYSVKKEKDNKLKIEKYTQTVKLRLLKKLFKQAYSINELVKISGTDELNEYIYKIISESQEISKLNYNRNAKSMKTLKNNLETLKKEKEERKKKIELVIKKFNNSNIKIIYSQNNIFDFENINFNSKKYIEINRKTYNLTKDGLIQYFYTLNEKKDVFSILELMINNNAKELLSIASLYDFQEIFDIKAVESGRIEIKKDSEEQILKEILREFFCDSKSEDINKLLKSYINNIDNFSIEFNVNSQKKGQKQIFRNIRQLSLGQKVVAMLTFILLYSNLSEDYTPLLIDQPEDNLDSQYIYETLVAALKEIKDKRQIIIATHNSTIVTNAKTENVIVMESDNNKGWIARSGYPTEDNILNSILNYLEGGKDSFNHKRKLYSEILDK